jgi:hypothetical protein
MQETVAPLQAQEAVALQHDVTSEEDWQRVLSMSRACSWACKAPCR